MCSYGETECDRVMGSVKEMEAFVIYALPIHKFIETRDIIWEGEAVVWGNGKCS
jgi:hypothetical protein